MMVVGFLASALTLTALVLEGEIFLSQAILFSQAFTLLLIIPFHFRGETGLRTSKKLWIWVAHTALLATVFFSALWPVTPEEGGPLKVAIAIEERLASPGEAAVVIGVYFVLAVLIAGATLRGKHAH